MSRPEHLPFDLLKTFTLIAELDGDAGAAAERLGISQPSISKRMAALRRVTSDPDRQPWLLLKGKRWQLTEEGRRIAGIVADVVSRYEQMELFVALGQRLAPVVALACGQHAASGFVRVAVERFQRQHPEGRVRIASPRGKARIEGVASGQFDMAIVTDSPATIVRTAKRELYIEELFRDQFVLVANPAPTAPWRKVWDGLPADRPVRAAELAEMPFILPEPDAFRRRQFDEWCLRSSRRTVDVALEIGGWRAILDYAEGGAGVGLVPRSCVVACEHRDAQRLSVRLLEPTEFPDDAVRLIARKSHGKNEPELAGLAAALADHVRHHSPAG
jgi:DNA-binding transcriptional LysR family regulator